jgi:hypothetical protein
MSGAPRARRVPILVGWMRGRRMGCSYHMRGAARYAVKERLDGVACNHTPKRLLAAAPRLAACALPPRPPLSPVAETAATARGDGDDGARRTARPISLPLWRAPALPPSPAEASRRDYRSAEGRNGGGG